MLIGRLEMRSLRLLGRQHAAAAKARLLFRSERAWRRMLLMGQQKLVLWQLPWQRRLMVGRLVLVPRRRLLRHGCVRVAGFPVRRRRRRLGHRIRTAPDCTRGGRRA